MSSMDTPADLPGAAMRRRPGSLRLRLTLGMPLLNGLVVALFDCCLLYTSDAADE